VILPRILDKGRATLAEKNGEYEYGCPLDQHFFEFAGVDVEALKREIAQGKGDRELFEWVRANSMTKPKHTEILAWSTYHEGRAPSSAEAREFFNELHTQSGPERDDISSWFDLLDLDDYVSFGGKA